MRAAPASPGFLAAPTRFPFFTGKGALFNFPDVRADALFDYPSLGYAYDALPTPDQ